MPDFKDIHASARRIALRGPRAVLITAISYFVTVFAFAFAMGVARTLVIAPLMGATAAVLLEVPILLAASWVIARRLLRNRELTLPQRIAVGTIAFVLTMASEVALSALMRGQSAGEWAANVATPLGLVGLAGQLGFAAIPALTGQRSRS
jgi:small-conductance mechanosensitive channel